MSNQPLSALDRARLYAKERQITMGKQIGGGWDGIVMKTDRLTVLKSLNNHDLYQRERDVYLYLKAKQIWSVSGFQIPKLVGLDDRLSVVEMTVVSPPYILDFAGASLKGKSPFTPEEWEAWRVDKMEQFESDWPSVKKAVNMLEGLGVYLNDVHPRNVAVR